MRYCTHCVMPDTKPDLNFNEEGVCNACVSYQNRSQIDWEKRARELENVLKRYRSSDQTHWDCVIPVSGGKDSTYQVVKILELGLNPLCVTATTCDLSEIGRKNIENIKNMGVDYIEFSPNSKIRKKLNRIGLEEVGDISWPEHVGIFTIPVNVAVRYKIPLIIWGENSQHEYGGPAAAAESNMLNRAWLEEFGGLLGLRVADLRDSYGIEQKYLIPYTYPTDAELARVGVSGLFLGYYIPWDGLSNALISQANGFTTYDRIVEGSMVNYENLDNYLHGIHDYFKYLKFGFGRASDIASLHIRRGRMTRQDGVAIVKKLDGLFPAKYLGKPLAKILSDLNVDEEQFLRTCDQFTNKQIFKLTEGGKLIKKCDGAPVLSKEIY